MCDERLSVVPLGQSRSARAVGALALFHYCRLALICARPTIG